MWIVRHHLGQTAVLFACLTVAACGGAGTSGPVTNTPGVTQTQSPPPVNYDTAEYRRNYGLAAIDTIPAYQAGLTGQGITVGVVDTGIDFKNPDLINNISPQSYDVQTKTYAGAQDEYGHGTWVSGIIAAEKNDVGIQGVAYNAKIMAVRADDHGDCKDGCTFYDYQIANGITYAVNHGARVINLSLGGDTGPNDSLKTALTEAVNAGVAVVIAAGNGVKDSTTGNYVGQAQPDALAQFAADPSVKGGIIIAGATDNNDVIASFSNKAGAAGGTQDVYMVAPGDKIRTTTLTTDTNVFADGTTLVKGTSLSAPHVVAAIAIMMQEFPDLTAKEIIQILFDTAKDLGALGADAVYGQGLVDIGAAIQPTGGLTVASVSGEQIQLTGTLLTSPAMGNGLTGAVSGALGFDSWHRAYKAALDRRFETPAKQFSLAGAAHSLMRQSTMLQLGHQNMRLGITAEDRNTTYASTSLERHALSRDMHPDVNFSGQVTKALSLNVRSGGAIGTNAATTGGLALTARGIDPASQLAATGSRAAFGYRLARNTSLGAAVFTGERAAPDGLHTLRQTGEALILNRQITPAHGPRMALNLELGRLHEDGSVLGMTGSGAFDAFAGADTDYLQMGGSMHLGSLDLQGAYMLSRTRGSLNQTSLFESLTPLHANGWALTLADTRFAAKGHVVGLHISQPMAVTSGSAALRLATGWANGAPTYESRTADLSVGARETDLELFHRFQAGSGLTLQSNFIYRLNPDNVAGAGGEAAVFLHLSAPL